jgi:3,4-dihydroxy 2-butanone 4-phosphate synthase/GTP cyclohydrolase II
VLCEIVDRRDGSMARTPQLLAFAKQQGLKCITIADLVRYRMRHEQQSLLTPSAAPVALDTRHGTFTAHTFVSAIDGSEHVALVHGALPAAGSSARVAAAVVLQQPVVDLFGSMHCGQSAPLDAAMGAAAASGSGIVLYVASATDGQPQGIAASLRAFAQQQQECSTSGSSLHEQAVSDIRDSASAASMLRALGAPAVLLPAGEAGMAQRLCGLGIDAVAAPAQQLDHGSRLQPAEHVNGRKEAALSGSAA